MQGNILDKIVNVIKKSAIYLLMFMANVLIVTTLLYFVKVTVTPYHLPIIYIITVVTFCFLYKREKWVNKLISILVATILLASSILVCGNIYDTTADGNTYHKLAIGALKNGWNPSYESVRDFNKEDGNVFDVSDDNINALWAEHYAKATEIFASVIYSFTDNIESGKAYTILFMYITFAIICSYLYENRKMNIIAAIAIAGVIAFNAITIVQIGNYYVDGALMLSLFLILYSCFVISYEEDKDLRKETFFVLAASIIWCINAKFTGLAFSGIFCCAFYIYWLYKSYKKGKEIFKQDLIKYTVFYIIVVIVAVVVVGFSSYTKNFIDHGHPLYPLSGEGHVDNMVIQEQPTSFQDKNHIEIFLISLFSKGQNVSPSYSSENVQPELKIPFTLTKEEVKNYTIPDIRMAGFGTLFSGIFIVSTIVACVMVVELIKKKQYDLLVPYLIIVGIIAALLIALDGGYWARYIPYVYALPIVSLIYLLYSSKNKPKMVVGIILAILMIVNSGLVFYVNVKSIRDNTVYAKNRLNEFKEYAASTENVDIKLNHWGLQGALYNLDDIGVENYTVIDEVQGENEGFFFKY